MMDKESNNQLLLYNKYRETMASNPQFQATSSLGNATGQEVIVPKDELKKFIIRHLAKIFSGDFDNKSDIIEMYKNIHYNNPEMRGFTIPEEYVFHWRWIIDSIPKYGFSVQNFRDAFGSSLIHPVTGTFFDPNGFDFYGYHQNGTLYGSDGFNVDDCDKDGYDRNGIDYFGRTRDNPMTQQEIEEHFGVSPEDEGYPNIEDWNEEDCGYERPSF